MNEFRLNDLPWRTPAPELDGETPPAPDFDARGVARTAGLELRRDIVQLPDGTPGVTLELTNRRDVPIRLRTLLPAELAQADVFPNADFRSLRVYRLARQKNDVPGPFSPAVPDAHLRTAAFDSGEITAGHGLSWENFNADAATLPRLFHSDPGMAFLPAEGAARALFAGFAGQTLHLNDVRLETTEDRDRLARLSAAAEFDGVCLAPGEARRTHPFVVDRGTSIRELLDRHAARIAALYGIRHGAPRNIYCTWYFYGADIDAAEVKLNLDSLRQDPIPFDVFQIDMGWEDRFGDWETDTAKFPEGMAGTARAIRAAGFTPGIWTAPLVIEPDSRAAREYPDIFLKDANGDPCLFACQKGKCLILDPFAPKAGEFLKNIFAKLARWGYTYHKLDFLRAVFLHPGARFRDPGANRAEACRRALELIRAAVGDAGHINACGGLFEGSAGLADVVRSGADLRGHWNPEEPTGIRAYAIRIRQNVFRNAYAKLWTTDPDALQLRRSEEVWRGNPLNAHLSCGRFTDEEAFSTVVNQFLAGGAVCASERLHKLDADRRELYRRVMPALAGPAEWFGPWTGALPELFATRCANGALPDWSVVTLVNWNDDSEKTLGFAPSEVPGLPAAEKYGAFELKNQEWLGVFAAGERIAATVPEHGARLIRLTPLAPGGVQVIGTDLSLSGGLEIEAFDGQAVRLSIQAAHRCRVAVLDRAGGDLLRFLGTVKK